MCKGACPQIWQPEFKPQNSCGRKKKNCYQLFFELHTCIKTYTHVHSIYTHKKIGK